MSDQDLKKTPLYDAHVAAGARMVPFAGYHMPVQYKDGVLKEHLWTREHAGLFDVSHMGQARIRGENPAKSFEKVVSADYQGLKAGKQRYGVLLNAQGGIIDDLMTARPDDDGLFIVVNGACKDNDYKIIAEALAGEATVERLEDRALLALQGPEAAAVLAAHIPQAAGMVFMDSAAVTAFGTDVLISRSGYTGEDGFEISVASGQTRDLADLLLADEAVLPVGLGARDSLRLEAGLCLYGHDIDTATTPVEAALEWAIQPARRRGGARGGGFPGAAVILDQIAAGVPLVEALHISASVSSKE